MSNATFTVDQALALGVKHHAKGELDQAANIYWQIINVSPKHVGALHNLGEILCRRKRFEQALPFLRRALEVDPDNPNSLNTMAVALMSLGRPEEAFELCQRAVKISPTFSNAHSNMGICYIDRGDPQASLASFRRAIELDPNNACAHDGLGLTLLMTGELQEGWREQEWRWRKYDFPPGRYPKAPHWRGQDLAGKTLMIYIEQGFGDVIHFCRYVPLLAERGVKVLFEEAPELSGLLRRSLSGAATFFPPNQPPPFDCVCALMSVPWLYGTTLRTIPARIPYLYPDPALVEQWRSNFQADPGFKVGIAWAGRPTHANDHNRSTNLAAFAPLAQVPGVTFYSLQKGPPAAQTAQPPAGMRIIDLSERLTDFDATAAVVSELDLVIAVDTALVHLAGAMGRPVWNLSPFCPDWRWMLNRSDSPWYPTMRVFRLPRRGDWPGVMEQVRGELAQAAGARKTGARETGTRETGAHKTGARKSGA